MARYTNLTSNASSDWTRLQNGSCTITGIGDFGGGTLTLEVKNPQGDPSPIEEFTESFTKVADFPNSVEIRGTLAGAAAPDIDLNIWGT